MRYPGASQHILGRQTEPEMRSHDIVCIHTMVGYLFSTHNMFLKNGFSGTESHFGIGGKWGSDLSRNLDGVVYQWQDLDCTADANLDGAHRVISIETADNAPRLPRDILPWTPKQVVSLVRLIHWLCSKAAHADCPSSWKCHQEGIPMKLIPDSKPGRRGIGFHRQGIDPWRVSGGERWSESRGKECPTDARIKQLSQVVIPRVQENDPTGENDMPLTTPDRKLIKDVLIDFWNTAEVIPNKSLDGSPTTTEWTPAGAAAAADQKLDLLRRDFTAELDDVKLALNQLLAILKEKS
jgi:hypothetical protein